MLTLAGLLVTAILAPAPGAGSELRTPVVREAAPTTATCECRCANDGLRDPFPGVQAAKASSGLAGADPGLRDPFDAPRRTTPVHRGRELSPRVRVPAPPPASTGGELRSPFGRA